MLISYKGQAIQADQIDAGELRFRKLIEHSNAGVTLLDRDLSGLPQSPCRTYRWPEYCEPGGTRHRCAGTSRRRRPLQEILLNVYARPGQPVISRFRTRHDDGRYFWIECTLTNLLNKPEAAAIVFNFVDITRQVELEEEQQRRTGFSLQLITHNENHHTLRIILNKFGYYVYKQQF